MRLIRFLLAAGLCVAAAGCTTTKDPEALAQNDPYEPTNRAVFDFDIKLDHAVANPVAHFYNDTLPEGARHGVHNALNNLNAPVVFANDVLQGESRLAGDTLQRFVVNSTLGLVGFLDVASRMGIPQHGDDFGITLANWGAGEGPYLVLPFIGPQPPRDIAGDVGDIGLDPLTYITFHGSTTWYLVRGGMGVLDTLSTTVDNVEQVERSSIDFYATTRSLYRQHRNAEIRHGATDTKDLPNL